MVGRIYIKGITKHCYTQNIKALGMVSKRKIILSFSYCKSVYYDLCRVPLKLLHTKYTGLRLCGFREEDFFMSSHYKPMVDNDAPGAWPIWIPGAWLAGFAKGIT